MIRRIGYILVVLAVALAAGGCSRPKTIPTRTLKEIFKDAFLVNAYYDSRPELRMDDSMDIYRPILQEHGYRVRDLEHTVQNFARQKSAKLSNVVESAIQELKDESEYLDSRIAARDTVATRASRMFMREVFFEPRITVRQVKDTSKLRISIPVEAGQYEVSFISDVDSLEENRGLRFSGRLIDSAQRVSTVPELSASLPSRQRKQYASVKFGVGADKVELELLLGQYPHKETKKPYLTIDSLRVTHFPLPQRAIDSLARTWYNLNLPPYADEKPSPADSSALRTAPDGPDPVGSGDDR